MAVYFMIFTVGQTLKLISFHHVLNDNRVLMTRINKGNKALTDETLSHQFNISMESF
jgi:hypothetical protein